MTSGVSSPSFGTNSPGEPFQLDLHPGLVEGPLVLLESRHCRVQIAPLGGQIVQWLFKNQDMLWLSKKRLKGKPLRGGIPICWPWFGPHPDGSAMPNHGVARTSTFEVVDQAPDRAVLQLTNNHLFAELRVWANDGLDLSLKTVNLGPTPQTVGAAFHTYFRVSDIASTHISGLDGTAYLDQLQNHTRCHQSGDVRFAEEVDRIYQTSSPVIINDGARRVVVASQRSSNSTVVWNPWQDKSARLGDMEPQDFRQMVCVETAWAGHDVRSLAPGASMTLEVAYRCHTV